MKDINNLLIDIKSTQAKYDKIKDKNRFNIFSALHKEHDEVNLHSRFISYLLASDSGHGMDNIFCEIFVREILKIDKTQFNLADYIVLPNERVKSEYKEIDVLIINKKLKQAIIIENKIGAPPSNHESAKEGYKGQLERYYNTIKKGIDKDDNDIQDFQCNTVHFYYLSLKKPPKEELRKWNESIYESVKYIRYDDQIINWLERIENIIPNQKSTLKDIVRQYLNIIKKMTHNDIPIDERIELKKTTATNWKSAKYLIENFKHLKWHTVYDFWNILKTRLESEYKNVSLYPDNIEKKIGEITHNNSDINIGILFDIDDNKKAYISSLGNLNWGILEPKKWMNFNGEITENISFSDFSTENTFRLIDKQNTEKAIDCILKEIKAEKENDLNNLKMD